MTSEPKKGGKGIELSKIEPDININDDAEDCPEKVTSTDCKCKKKCYEFVKEQERKAIRKTLSSLPDKNSQDLYLQGLIVAKDIKQRRRKKDVESTKRRVAFFEYFALVGSRRVNVCKQAFLTIHGVSNKRVSRLLKLLISGEIPVDKRGKNVISKHILPAVLKSIGDHIRSFPVTTITFGLNELEYLDAGLNVSKMHQLFLKKYPRANVSLKIYRDYFKDKFNYSFGLPKVDFCKCCKTLAKKIKSCNTCSTKILFCPADLIGSCGKNNLEDCSLDLGESETVDMEITVSDDD